MKTNTKNIRRFLRVTTLLAALAFSLTAQASLLLYDGFDYTAGETVIGKRGGSGNWATTDGAWRTAGTGPSTLVNTDSLAYTDSGGGVLATGGGSLSISTTDGGGTYRNISGISVEKTAGGTGTYWISFITSTSGIPNGQSSNYAALTLTTNGDPFHVGAFGSSANWRMRVGNGTYSDAKLTPASTVQTFVVMRVDINLSGDDALRLWINPTLGSTDLTNASATASLTGNYWDGDSFSLSFLRIGTNGNGGTIGINVDEFRLGTTYADVAVTAVPETAGTAMFLGAGFLVVGILLRKKFVV